MVCNLNIDEKFYIIRRDLQQTSRVLHHIRSRYSHTSNQFKLESTNDCVTNIATLFVSRLIKILLARESANL